MDTKKKGSKFGKNTFTNLCCNFSICYLIWVCSFIKVLDRLGTNFRQNYTQKFLTEAQIQNTYFIINKISIFALNLTMN